MALIILKPSKEKQHNQTTISSCKDNKESNDPFKTHMFITA